MCQKTKQTPPPTHTPVRRRRKLKRALVLVQLLLHPDAHGALRRRLRRLPEQLPLQPRRQPVVQQRRQPRGRRLLVLRDQGGVAPPAHRPRGPAFYVVGGLTDAAAAKARAGTVERLPKQRHRRRALAACRLKFFLFVWTGTHRWVSFVVMLVPGVEYVTGRFLRSPCMYCQSLTYV